MRQQVFKVSIVHRQLLEGDEAAFAALYARLNPSMVRVATAITGNTASGEEVAQDAWLAVLAKLADFQGRASLKNWIFAILTNKARTRARRDGRSIGLELETDESLENLTARFSPDGSWQDPPALWDEITPERILGGRETWNIVSRAIAELPPAQRAILTLLEGEKLSAAEIAEILNTSPGNVRVHLHRGREKIRQVLEKKLSG